MTNPANSRPPREQRSDGWQAHEGRSGRRLVRGTRALLMGAAVPSALVFPLLLTLWTRRVFRLRPTRPRMPDRHRSSPRAILPSVLRIATELVVHWIPSTMRIFSHPRWLKSGDGLVAVLPVVNTANDHHCRSSFIYLECAILVEHRATGLLLRVKMMSIIPGGGGS